MRGRYLIRLDPSTALRQTPRRTLKMKTVNEGVLLAPSILLVDDDPDIREALADLLEHHGYRVDSVSTGAQAIERAQVDRFGSVILDLNLPIGRGLPCFEFCRKESPQHPF